MLSISICFTNTWKKIKCSKAAANSQIGGCPVCFIIPEYISRQIVEKGTEEQKRRAWQNLILTEQLRGRRNIAGSVFAVADKLHRTIFDTQNSESLPGKLVRSEGGKSKGGRAGAEEEDVT